MKRPRTPRPVTPRDHANATMARCNPLGRYLLAMLAYDNRVRRSSIAQSDCTNEDASEWRREITRNIFMSGVIRKALRCHPDVLMESAEEYERGAW